MGRSAAADDAVTDASAPDWASVTRELRCPMCDYNLFGLTEPRCPECGFRFGWAELLSADRVPHRYLFEHHPESNFKSFWKTAWGGLRPWRFWRELSPAMPSRPRRLTVYAVRVALLAACALVGYAALPGVDLALAARVERSHLTPGQLPAWFSYGYSPAAWPAQIPRWSQGATPPPPPPPPTIDDVYPMPPSLGFIQWLLALHPDIEVVLDVTVLCVAWPWGTYATLMIFRWSMRRVKVRSIHVRRCVTYSFDTVVWVGAAVLVGWPVYQWAMSGATPLLSTLGPRGAGALQPFLPGNGYYIPVLAPVFWSVTLAGAAVICYSVYRLSVAYAYYLRFDRPVLTVLSSQLILLLILGCVVFASNGAWAGCLRDALGYFGGGYSLR